MHHEVHSGAICEGCRDYHRFKLVLCIKTGRSQRETCQRPWELGPQPTHGTIHRQQRIFALFGPKPSPAENKSAVATNAQEVASGDEPGVASDEKTTKSNVSPPGDKAAVAAAANATTTESSESPPGKLDPCSLDDSFVRASSDKYIKQRGATKIFDNNQITEELATRIINSLDGRTSLAEHEKRLLHRLAAVNPSVMKGTIVDDRNVINKDVASLLAGALKERTSLENHEVELRDLLSGIEPSITKKAILSDGNVMTDEITSLLEDALSGRADLKVHEEKLLDALVKIKPPVMRDTVLAEDGIITEELTKLLTPILKSRKSLSDHEKRLLGQLACIAFEESEDDAALDFLNFPHCQRIHLVRLPRQLKKGDELNNKKLFSSRIKTGKKWMKYLPGSFHDELVASLFLEIDKTRAASVLRRYHNKHLRMCAENSSTLRNFVGLNDRQYIRLMRALFYFAGMRILAPISHVYLLRSIHIKEQFSTRDSDVVDMSRKTKSGKKEITRQIKVLVTTIRPFECVLVTMSTLLQNKMLLKSTERFNSPVELHENFEDIVLYAVKADAGGGSFKMITNNVNVDKPQSLQHVLPLMEFTAKDSTENVRAAFEANPKIISEVEDLMHRRSILVNVKFAASEMQSVIVKNSNPAHHRSSPQPLPKMLSIHDYRPVMPVPPRVFDDQVAKVDVTLVASIEVLYNKLAKVFDGVRFLDNCGSKLAVCYFKKPVSCENPSNFTSPDASQPKIDIDQYLLAGIFTADLDFLAKLLGHQGASAKWLCMFCLAMQEKLKDTFVLGGNGPGFLKRTLESIKKMHADYIKHFESLPTGEQSKPQ